MVGVVWPRDPLQRVEVEDGLRFKLEWKMIWSDDNQFTRVNCVACNPQDRVYLYLPQIDARNAECLISFCLRNILDAVCRSVPEPEHPQRLYHLLERAEHNLSGTRHFNQHQPNNREILNRQSTSHSSWRRKWHGSIH